MATLLQAIRTHGPKLVYNRTATTAEMAVWLAGRSGLTRGQVLLVLSELHDAIRAHAASGTHTVRRATRRKSRNATSSPAASSQLDG